MLTVGTGLGVEVDGRLAGMVILNRFGRELAVIATLLVAPEHRRHGLGRHLMEQALERAGDAAVHLYASPQGQLLYRELGFVASGETLRMGGPPAVPLQAPARIPRLRSFHWDDFMAVCALDAEAQGADRGPLLEALLAFGDRAWLVEDEGRLTGFGLSFLTGGARVLGPIVTRDPADGPLLAAALAAGAGEPLLLDLEPGEEALAAWARTAGLATIEISPRMVLRGVPLPGHRSLIRALAGRPFG
jgi:predicted GNAT family acetyltransferase